MITVGKRHDEGGIGKLSATFKPRWITTTDEELPAKLLDQRRYLREIRLHPVATVDLHLADDAGCHGTCTRFW